MLRLQKQISFGQAVQTSIRGVGTGLRVLAAASLTVLAACGGGGGSDGDSSPVVVGPPTVAAALVNTSSEAQQSAPAAVAAADSALKRISALGAFSAFAGAPVTPLGAAPEGRKFAMAAHTKRAQAAEALVCGDLLDAPCSGSAVGDTNITSSAVRAGDWVTIQFQSLDGWLFGQQLSFNGGFRMDFQAAMSLDSETLAGADVKMTFEGFSGSLNGASFGPITEAFRLQVSLQGVETITAGGASFTGLSGLSVTGNGSYTIGGGTVRVSYWSDSSKYVDLSYSNWQLVSGRPTFGSTVTVATSGSDRITLSVTSSSTNTVVYRAAIQISGITTYYRVTATYPAGSDIASYVAVLELT